MNCEKANEMLYDYIDDCLDDELRQEIEEHIKGCNECRKEYELISAILSNCHNFEEEDLPHDFERNLHDRLMSEKHDAGRKGLGIRFNRINAVAAAALILAISMGVIFGSGILNSRKESGTAMLNTASDSASPKIAAAVPSPENETLQFSITAGAAANGNAPSSQDQEYGTGVAKSDDRSAGRGMSYYSVTIKIDDEQYANYYKSIVSSIEEASGYLMQKAPETYVLPLSNWDALNKKFTEEYKISDITVNSDDVSKQYAGLKDEISSLEEKAKESSNNGDGGDINKQLDEKKAQLAELDKKIGNAYIEINIYQDK